MKVIMYTMLRFIRVKGVAEFKDELISQITLATSVNQLEPSIFEKMLKTLTDTRCWHFTLGKERYIYMPYQQVLRTFLPQRGRGQYFITPHFLEHFDINHIRESYDLKKFLEFTSL